MAAAVITTPLSQSSLLFLSKPSSFSLPPRPSFPLVRFSCPSRFTALFAAASDIRSSEKIEFREEIGGGGGVGGKGSGGSGGGGGGGGGEESEGGEEKDEKKTGGMSMSQKLTLGYAALVGVGGVMGYVKSGSQKSLAAGGFSALLLYYVYTQFPTRPAFASSLGLGLSAALLAVMGSRFKRSGKVFPAGVVSVVSFVMAGGYLHGILRSTHA